MRSCQLCDCRSWGPVKDPAALEDIVVAAHPGVGPDATLLECDGCGALAREDLIADPMLPTLMDGGPATVRTACTRRTERLVRDLIASRPRQGSSQSTEDYAKWLVICASHIDAALDANASAVAPVQTAQSTRPRNFEHDFLTPAVNGLTEDLTQRIALALDCAIAFGALEGQTTNTSLKLSGELERMYWEKVERLRAQVY